MKRLRKIGWALTVAAMIMSGAFLIMAPIGCGKTDDNTGPTDPTNPGSPTDPNTTGANDALKLEDVTWARVNPSTWKKTGEITKQTVAPSGFAYQVCWEFTHPDYWPKDENAGKIIGNHWVIAKINGKYYGAPWEGVRPGNAQCSITENHRGEPIFIQTEDGLGQIDCHKFPLALRGHLARLGYGVWPVRDRVYLAFRCQVLCRRIPRPRDLQEALGTDDPITCRALMRAVLTLSWLEGNAGKWVR